MQVETDLESIVCMSQSQLSTLGFLLTPHGNVKLINQRQKASLVLTRKLLPNHASYAFSVPDMRPSGTAGKGLSLGLALWGIHGHFVFTT